MLRKLIAASALIALSACATPAETSDSSGSSRDCFRTVDVNSYGIVDDRRIRATVSASREYHMTLAQNARDLDWTRAITLRSTTSFICVGNGLGVQVIGGESAIPYQVIRIERVPDDTPAGS